MKLHEHDRQGLNTITSYGDGFVAVNGVRHTGGLLVMPERAPEHWPVESTAHVDADRIGHLIALQPELILFGTGSAQHFLHPRELAPLVEARIGHEVMTTASACRTYNILMAEGRRVLAALLPIEG
ncbi:MAG: Mth938-like domain-containing protein [Burkholderiaceae bacterium]